MSNEQYVGWHSTGYCIQCSKPSDRKLYCSPVCQARFEEDARTQVGERRLPLSQLQKFVAKFGSDSSPWITQKRA